jgi:Arc/MetJ-type ribon-helix-helix transcriptional regulator
VGKATTKIVAARLTQNLTEIMHEYCRRDAHLNFSDLIRDAVREKIQREAPELYSELFKETPKNERK